MKRSTKAAIVIGGYLLAALIATAIVLVQQRFTSTTNAQASAGMVAFSDLALFCGAFAVLAVLPTAAMLVFLRSYRPFWIALASLASCFAIAAMISFAMTIFAKSSVVAVLILFAAAPVGVVLLIASLLAPGGWPRMAALISGLVSVGAPAAFIVSLLVRAH